MGVADEIVLGLVLHLDPDVLEAQGSTVTGPSATRVRGPHFFMCVGLGDTPSAGGTWLPLFSEQGVGRVAVDKTTAYGHPKWKDGDSYYHPAQVWTATHGAVATAAQAGGDLSKPGSRNGMAADALPVIGSSEDRP
ncbi:MAG: hypothetical protein ACRDQ2_18740 [Gaiellales bacterium]